MYENFGKWRGASRAVVFQNNISSCLLSGTSDPTLLSPGGGNLDDDDDDDKTELLSSNKKSPSFWTFEYYQTFFDVDTDQVVSRILGMIRC